jgi:hypothetical protein
MGKDPNIIKMRKKSMPEIRIIKIVLKLLSGGNCGVENYPPKALKPLKQ